jgi:ketosteroid isomerase-like protein
MQVTKILFALSGLLFYCQLLSAQDNPRREAEAIRMARKASNQAIASRDVEGISRHWLDDFVQVRGNGSFLTGKENIIASWKSLFQSDTAVLYIRNPKEIIISQNGIMAWETGEWLGIHSYSHGGNYSAMWRKRNGEWKLQAELFVALKN